VYITIRPQGVLDAGPVFPVEELLPYEKCIPLLKKLSRKVGAPLVVILMGWEKAGPWVYPDSFPPAGGEESMTGFIRSIRDLGWHAGSFCNGTRWVVGHAWNDYDGRDYFRDHGGEECVCREPDGTPWKENWDAHWRPSYSACLGAERTWGTARDTVKRIMQWGMESLQFFDQNNGAAVFPCFAEGHGHPPVPGKWMAEKMREFMKELRTLATEVGEDAVVQSAESGLNETCLQLFQLTELRTFPPGYGVDIVPLYQYLYHECVVLQGMMGNAPEPHHLAIRNAVNCVLGGIPGGVLTGKGTLLDKDTNNWAHWDPEVENQENALMMIRAVAAMRRGPGKDFLVYGRMLRPAVVENVEIMKWSAADRQNQIPAVFHSAWQAPDGRIAVVLANWTANSRKVVVMDSRLGPGAIRHCSADRVSREEVVVRNNSVDAVLPPLSSILIEGCPRVSL
jgi:hypothetical protein